jgi:NADH dehydrogenase/NADH:ubiquinone oxidoreductase subunit G
MNEVELTIDGKTIKAQKGMTVLEAAQNAGITIPTLCHHEKLKPYTVCRICTVEIDGRSGVIYDTACSRPLEKNMVVRTRSENIDKIRKSLLELMLAHAPEAPALKELAIEYGADKDRFEKGSSFCILCGLCVRYCNEIKKKKALAFIDRGVQREIYFIPEIASQECWNCKECFPLCPTSALQAAYFLAKADF